MKIKIEIECNNSAFYDDDGNFTPHIEVARLLEELSMQVNCNGLHQEQKIFDLNGNIIGKITKVGK